MTTPNRQRFAAALLVAYTDLFTTDPEYSYSAAHCTPEGLSKTMTMALAAGTGNHDGKGIRRACKAVGIKPTRRAILEYLR